MDLRQQFNKRVGEPTKQGCWKWIGSFHSTGYGRLWLGDGKHEAAHRISYRLYKGEIGDLRVCHTCDNRWCVNPAHLFLGTGEDNSFDMMRKKRHWTKLTEEQVVYIRSSHEGSRPLAAKLGVSHTLIKRIRRGQCWRHLS